MFRRTVLALVFAVLVIACSDDGDDGTATTADPYPPSGIAELAEIFDPQLEPLGVRVTRGGVFDRSDGGWTASPDGEHLALYVEPLDDADYDTADYVEGLGSVTALVTPQVFERWSGVETYDICQEPPSALDDSDTPAPYTQIEIGRAAAESVDWDEATTSTVIALGRTDDMRLVVTQVVRDDPAYVEAETQG